MSDTDPGRVVDRRIEVLREGQVLAFFPRSLEPPKDQALERVGVTTSAGLTTLRPEAWHRARLRAPGRPVVSSQVLMV